MRTIAFGFILGLAALGGCGREEASRISTTTMTSASITPTESAIQNITSTRCSRQLACNNAGVGPYYEGLDSCVRELSPDTHAKLRAESCPNGIADSELSTCLNDIRNEACVKPIDTIDRIPSCRSARLCR